MPVKEENMEKIDENKSSEVVVKVGKVNSDPMKMSELPVKSQHSCLEFCSDKDNCLSLYEILRSFNAPLSEDQAWSLIFQSVRLYRDYIRIEFIDKNTRSETTAQKTSHRIKVPRSTRSLNVHKDGYVHISDNGE